MKLTSAIVVIVAFLGIGAWYARSQSTTQPATMPATSLATLGVEELMRHVEQHKGSVSVVGVVGAASADKKLVTLIDTKEFAACNDTECAELVLPVRWSGPMPAMKKAVRVEGEVQESGGKLVFVASALKETSK